jgi:hypothetical protein
MLNDTPESPAEASDVRTPVIVADARSSSGDA